MRRTASLALAPLVTLLSGCGDSISGFDLPLHTFGPPIRDLPSSTMRFEPAQLTLAVGETKDVTLRINDPRLWMMSVRWFGDEATLVSVSAFECVPASSCGLLRPPTEVAHLQLSACSVMRMRVTGHVAGRTFVIASADEPDACDASGCYTNHAAAAVLVDVVP